MDKETVRTICYLSRLSLSEDGAKNMETDLDTILSMIDQLQEIDTSNIEPMFSPLEQTAIIHDDEVNSDNQKDAYLDQAPESDSNFFRVPKVVE
ncbi:MAG: Asp-tRNA(Asn)/Glu-tRNA(Gln) amidotransferase subunit GatC [Gammaproteobacteria bacterium]